MTFKFFSNMNPKYINNVFKPAGQLNTITRASLLKLNWPLQKIKHRQNNISYTAPSIQNNLPDF